MLDQRTDVAFSVADPAAAAVLRLLRDAGYSRVEPSILQDAGSFLDLGGEDIRASLYFTSDRSGRELCLRPEYTIPVCKAYLASPDAGKAARFAYCGPVFRQRQGTVGEFVQAGLENFGATDTAAADAEILSLSLEAVAAAGGDPVSVRFGDAGLLVGLLDALRLPPNWQRRLKRGLDRGETPDTILAAAPGAQDDRAGVLAAMEGTDAAGARALVEDLLSIAGIKAVGGRTAHEIADRFLGQVALRSAPPFGGEQRAVLNRFLAVQGDPDAAASRLRTLVSEAGLDLAEHLDLFEARTSFMAACNVDLSTVRFEAAFGRNLDYYTGFVFEAVPSGGRGRPVVGGGRYDRLAESLKSPMPVPAVGASIWLDRLGGAAQTDH